MEQLQSSRQHSMNVREGGREGRREGGREGGKEGGREGGREGWMDESWHGGMGSGRDVMERGRWERESEENGWMIIIHIADCDQAKGQE